MPLPEIKFLGPPGSVFKIPRRLLKAVQTLESNYAGGVSPERNGLWR
jgi:hypothetical protein